MTSWKHEFIEAHGIRMHYVTAGKGPLVILLHGFPQFWYSWRHQIPALAEQFQVVVPDLRGYGDTDRPVAVADYRSKLLAEDVVGLVHGLGQKRAHIVGHDWGGVAAWMTALQYPEVVDHLVVLNCPHPYIFAKALQSNWKQIRRSWYMFLFQLPYLPELLYKTFSTGILERILRGSAIRKEAFTDDDLKQYHQALEKPGAITAALNYYRAAFRYRSKEKLPKISAPTLFIWGEKDVALGKELTLGMEPLFEGLLKIQYVPNCSHWVHEEQPDLINRCVVEFLAPTGMDGNGQ